MIVFVGDKPSRLNIDPSIPFIGTPSHKTLVRWQDQMGVNGAYLINSYTHDDLVRICQLFNERKHQFVALGLNASKALKKLEIDHFRLPHPSPKNRLLNNKNFIDSELEKCKNYLKGKGKCA